MIDDWWCLKKLAQDIHANEQTLQWEKYFDCFVSNNVIYIDIDMKL